MVEEFLFLLFEKKEIKWEVPHEQVVFEVDFGVFLLLFVELEHHFRVLLRVHESYLRVGEPPDRVLLSLENLRVLLVERVPLFEQFDEGRPVENPDFAGVHY